MISAVDTNVLLDILIPDAPHGDESERRLADAVGAGSIVICEAVYTELAAYFEQPDDLEGFVEDTGIRLGPSSRVALHRAGGAWRVYARQRSSALVCPQCGTARSVRCEECGAPLQVRQHVVADFMIGAHAVEHADRLITRDRGYYAAYFPELELA